MNDNKLLTSDNIRDIYHAISNDPTIASEIDISALIAAMDNKSINGIKDKSLSSIANEISDVILSLSLNNEDTLILCNKLTQYRFIDEICDVTFGRYVRWIRNSHPKKLTNGGSVVNVKFGDDGAVIMVKCGNNQIIQYKFDECITFQKLLYDEQMILMLSDVEINNKL